MLITNSLDLCLSQKVLISLSPWKDNFARHRILVGWFFFQHFISRNSFPAYMVSEKKFDFILILVFLYLIFSHSTFF